ncbi:MAG: hypothetical protein JNN29_15620 [Chitinophagaceae bacterium]|nr:hypothetical protein [Chitinophagaceae bacterium]MBN8667713.1 hypothetical protein [Chitinophagales bacterium]
MKKMFWVFLLLAISGTLAAQGGPGRPGRQNNSVNRGYVDANKNNVCDRYENGNVPGSRMMGRRNGGGGTCLYRTGNANVNRPGPGLGRRRF